MREVGAWSERLTRDRRYTQSIRPSFQASGFMALYSGSNKPVVESILYSRYTVSSTA